MSEVGDREVKIKVKRADVRVVVVLIKEREQVLRMIQNLQRPGTISTVVQLIENNWLSSVNGMSGMMNCGKDWVVMH